MIPTKASFFSKDESLKCFFLKILLNLLGWCWLIKLHRLRVYNSIIHHVYIVLYVHHPKSNLLPSSLIPHLSSSAFPTSLSLQQSPYCCLCLWFYLCLILSPFLPSLCLNLLPLWQLSVCSMYPCLCFHFVHQFILFIRCHIWVRSYGICLSPTGLFHLA